jgi:radical SAM superfamily enzyme YgiQ (UPF0313 family)
MRGIRDLNVDMRLRGFIKSQLFTDEQAIAMREAGFRWILVGFEAGHERILSSINKKATRDDNTRCMDIAKRNGLKVKALMSCGHPGESQETIEALETWLCSVVPDAFDLTVISAYPGTPYYDHSVETAPGEWTYTAKTGDRFISKEIDFTTTADYYKGAPGEYKSYVHTDYLSAEDIVALRDQVETNVRKKLNIPFDAGAPGIQFEHSMGQAGPLPQNILRRSEPLVVPARTKLPVLTT